MVRCRVLILIPRVRTSNTLRRFMNMNEIIKNIEAAQLKETVPSFNVGDTVRVSAKIRENPGVRGNCYQETERRSKRDLHCQKEFQRHRR